jgi:hypothetical protein
MSKPGNPQTTAPIQNVNAVPSIQLATHNSYFITFFCLYISPVASLKRVMLQMWWLFGVVALFLGVIIVRQLSPDSRLRRRRRKSHGPIVSKSRKPLVRFSVRPPRDK